MDMKVGNWGGEGGGAYSASPESPNGGKLRFGHLLGSVLRHRGSSLDHHPLLLPLLLLRVLVPRTCSPCHRSFLFHQLLLRHAALWQWVR